MVFIAEITVTPKSICSVLGSLVLADGPLLCGDLTPEGLIQVSCAVLGLDKKYWNIVKLIIDLFVNYLCLLTAAVFVSKSSNWYNCQYPKSQLHLTLTKVTTMPTHP